MELTRFGEQLKDQIFSMDITKEEIVTHSFLGMEGYALLVDAMNRCENPGNNVGVLMKKYIRRESLRELWDLSRSIEKVRRIGPL